MCLKKGGLPKVQTPFFALSGLTAQGIFFIVSR